jgi:Icc-related predicted phosphoesterase
LKVSYCSDLHLEFRDLELPGGDILILAGDICEAKNLLESWTPGPKLLFEQRSQVHDRYNRFFADECSKYQKVIYVMGNHEHYDFTYDHTYKHIKSLLPNNVFLLENESIEIDNVVFIGATLWTDLNGNDPITESVIRQHMNDYQTIKVLTENQRKSKRNLRPSDTFNKHQNSLLYIKQVVESNDSREYVVITHHAPSKTSTKPQYQGDYHVNGAYSSCLDQFIQDHPQIRAWHHGHTHDSFKYMIGETWIMCNPRGYCGYEHQAKNFELQSYDIINGRVIIK